MRNENFEELIAPNKLSHIILWTSFAFIIIFFTWAYFAKIDEVTHAEGKVIPSQRVQVIQNLEGGIVSAIKVNEGEIVQKDQVLMVLNDLKFSNDFKENKLKELAFEAKIARLNAQLNNSPFILRDEIVNALPELSESEKALYKSRVREMKMMDTNLKLTEKEITMTKPLISSGAVSRVEILRLEQQLIDIKGKIANAKSADLNELNTKKAELAGLRESNNTLKDRLDRTTIRSPVDGIVKQLHVNTVGGVIKPGMDLMEVVPLDDTLLISAKVKPKDIGFINFDQHAMVKITAYDFSIYGGLEGKVEHIGADTKIDDTNSREPSYYEIWVRTDKKQLEKNGKNLRIIPGMTATVDILTGDKTVFDYIMKPILKAKQVALRER